MLEALKNHPVRIMAILTAVVALIAHYVPDLPVPLILAIPAAVLGMGEIAASKVTPTRNIPHPEN